MKISAVPAKKYRNTDETDWKDKHSIRGNKINQFWLPMRYQKTDQ
jgi:hypothetical protein